MRRESQPFEIKWNKVQSQSFPTIFGLDSLEPKSRGKRGAQTDDGNSIRDNLDEALVADGGLCEAIHEDYLFPDCMPWR